MTLIDHLPEIINAASVFHPNNYIHLASGYRVFRDIIRSIAGPASRYGRIWYIFVLQNQLQEISFIFFSLDRYEFINHLILPR